MKENSVEMTRLCLKDQKSFLNLKTMDGQRRRFHQLKREPETGKGLTLLVFGEGEATNQAGFVTQPGGGDDQLIDIAASHNAFRQCC